MNIYLDYNSTTPVDKRVLESMLPFFTEKFGNASSRTHSYGWLAEDAVKIARKQVSGFLNCEEGEIVFTSGATEAINLAIKGVAEAYISKGKHIVTAASEHKAVLDTCKHLAKQGFPRLAAAALYVALLSVEDRSNVCCCLRNRGVVQVSPWPEQARRAGSDRAVLI